MGHLAQIWITALVMSAVAILWMSGLILLRLFHDHQDLRRGRERDAVTDAILAVLQKAPDAEARLAAYADRPELFVDALPRLNALIRGDDQERVAEALARVGVQQHLVGGLETGPKARRLASLEALAGFHGEAVVGALRKSTRQTDPEIRLTAFRALADAGSPPPIGQLVDLLIAEKLVPSGAFVDLLNRVVAAAPDQAMTAMQRRDLVPEVRAILVAALGSSGDYQVIPLLIDAAEDAETEVRIAAIRGLGRLQHPIAEPTLAAAIKDAAWPVRSMAAEAVGAAGLASLAGPVADLLADPEWWVRFRAGEALIKLGPSGRAHLQRAAYGADPLAQAAAELALTERRSS